MKKPLNHTGVLRDKENTAEIILKVQEIIWHTPTLFELHLDRGGIEFTPGDCISIFTGDGKTSRPYSIASGIHAPELSFLIRTMATGVVTSYLMQLNPGDSVKVTSPYGWFRPGKPLESKPFVFIATGTGIAPFLSYIESYPDKPPLKFLYGVRKIEDAVGYHLFSQKCSTKLAVSREGSTEHYRGRVTGLLPTLPLLPEIHYYLCGLDSMIEEVTAWLEKHNIEPSNIHREVFFYASY